MSNGLAVILSVYCVMDSNELEFLTEAEHIQIIPRIKMDSVDLMETRASTLHPMHIVLSNHMPLFFLNDRGTINSYCRPLLYLIAIFCHNFNHNFALVSF